ncbi:MULTISPECIES: MgtC/SapB family protein [unclassified Herbaspirillum]|uniref:MgtC/SapB family protein n=1 Tax=unclassified Herbaspirillum TaxID=2624150 RepID=UPI001153A575|nr:MULTISPECIES: MgtC/SapB family protein [unclassified Herbaspirillum]MBB5393535.1 putative Mg2+ transporter-C (MgtC) family protein [Herbaspirillum sp. SJZ102]TQK03717.1 putative Mg2+ transporter-C (MgtC) family protein [Herbaspirillum sp. SJZ130]TQK08449.1 putative Mg2+ transporter-C (MgtC) family protein [Herbaspirillum sp. SJZ106]TWC71716.1 putative Mg2+ transporter-C (MgtC) family protein [Herbaspirillum sp. SJZ099]
MSDHFEIFLRLLIAMLIGCAIGIDRNLRGKPTGMKTLGLVALGSALATMASMNFALTADGYSHDAVSRAIQGVITGIGFLGAGVIIHEQASEKVRGLTTAASIWVTAAVGIVCGIGWWKVALMATVLVLLLFTVGRRIENVLHRRWMKKADHERAAIAAREED